MELSRTIETETGEMIVKRVSVPLGLEELMEGLAKEVILRKPKDIYVFASEYFSRLLQLRDSGLYRGNVRSAKLAVKQPSKAMMVGHNIFSSSDSDHFSRKDIERKPSTPYYLNHSSRSVTRADEIRRARIREHLRLKKEEYADNESSIESHSTRKKQNSIPSNSQSRKLINVSASTSKNKRKDSADKMKTGKKSYGKNDTKRGTSTDGENVSPKPKKYREYSKSKDTNGDIKKKFFRAKRTSSESSFESSTKASPTIMWKKNCVPVEEDIRSTNKSLECIEKVLPTDETCLVKSGNLSIKTRTISSTQDDRGHYEVSYNPDLLASDRETQCDSEASLNLKTNTEITNERFEINSTRDTGFEKDNNEENNEAVQDLETSIEFINKNNISENDDSDSKQVKEPYKLKSIIIIQSLWRGVQSRKKINKYRSNSSSNEKASSSELQQNVSKHFENKEKIKEKSIPYSQEQSQVLNRDSYELKMENIKDINNEVVTTETIDSHISDPDNSKTTALSDQSCQNTAIQSTEEKYDITEKLKTEDSSNNCHSVDVNYLTPKHQSNESEDTEEILSSTKNSTEYDTQNKLSMSEGFLQNKILENQPVFKNTEHNIAEHSSYLAADQILSRNNRDSEFEEHSNENEDDKYKELKQEISNMANGNSKEKKPKEFDAKHLEVPNLGQIASQCFINVSKLTNEMVDDELTSGYINDNHNVSNTKEECSSSLTVSNFPHDDATNVPKHKVNELKTRLGEEVRNDNFLPIKLKSQDNISPQIDKEVAKHDNSELQECRMAEQVVETHDVADSNELDNQFSQQNETDDRRVELVNVNSPKDEQEDYLSLRCSDIERRSEESNTISLPITDKQIRATSNSELLEPKNDINSEAEKALNCDEILKIDSIDSVRQSDQNSSTKDESGSTTTEREVMNRDSGVNIIRKQKMKYQKKTDEKEDVNRKVLSTKKYQNRSFEVIDDKKDSKSKYIKKRSYSHTENKTQLQDETKRNEANLKMAKSEENDIIFTQKKGVKNYDPLEKKIAHKDSKKSITETIVPRKSKETERKKDIRITSEANENENIIEPISDFNEENENGIIHPIINNESSISDMISENTEDIMKNNCGVEQNSSLPKSSKNIDKPFNQSNILNTEEYLQPQKNAVIDGIPVLTDSKQNEGLQSNEADSEQENETSKYAKSKFHELINEEVIIKFEPIRTQVKDHEDIRSEQQNNASTRNEIHEKESNYSTLSKKNFNSEIVDGIDVDRSVLKLTSEIYSKPDNSNIGEFDDIAEQNSSREPDNKNVDLKQYGQLAEYLIITEVSDNGTNDNERLGLIDQTETQKRCNESPISVEESHIEGDISVLKEGSKSNVISLDSANKQTNSGASSSSFSDVTKASSSEKVHEMQSNKLLEDNTAEENDIKKSDEELSSSKLLKILSNDDDEEFEKQTEKKIKLRDFENDDETNLLDRSEMIEESLNEVDKISRKENITKFDNNISSQSVEDFKIQLSTNSITSDEIIKQLEPQAVPEDSQDNNKNNFTDFEFDTKKNITPLLIPQVSTSPLEVELLDCANTKELHIQKSTDIDIVHNKQTLASNELVGVDYVNTYNGTEEPIIEKNTYPEEVDTTPYGESKVSENNMMQVADKKVSESSLKESVPLKENEQLTSATVENNGTRQNDATSLQEFLNHEKIDNLHSQNSISGKVPPQKIIKSVGQLSPKQSIHTEKSDENLLLNSDGFKISKRDNIHNIISQKQSFNKIDSDKDINNVYPTQSLPSIESFNSEQISKDNLSMKSDNFTISKGVNIDDNISQKESFDEIDNGKKVNIVQPLPSNESFYSDKISDNNLSLKSDDLTIFKGDEIEKDKNIAILHPMQPMPSNELSWYEKNNGDNLSVKSDDFTILKSLYKDNDISQKQSFDEIEAGKYIKKSIAAMQPIASNDSLCSEKMNEKKPRDVCRKLSEDIQYSEEIVQPLISVKRANSGNDIVSDIEKINNDQSTTPKTDSSLKNNISNLETKESEKSKDQISSTIFSNAEVLNREETESQKFPQVDDPNIFNSEEFDEIKYSAPFPNDKEIINLPEIESAIQIQKIWRGFQARKNLSNIFQQKESQELIIPQKKKPGINTTDENKNIINTQDESFKCTNETLVKIDKFDLSQENTIPNENDKISEDPKIKSNTETLFSENDIKAALKIQSSFRRFKSRKRKHFQNFPLSNLNLNTDIGRDYVNQALKIQSAWRAYKVRKNIREVEEKINQIEHHSGNKLPKSIHLTDEEILRAVTKIQASLRGYMARKHFKNLLERNQSLEGIQEEPNSEIHHLQKNVDLLSDEQILNTLKKLDNVNVPNTPPEIGLKKRDEHITDDTVRANEEIDESQNISKNILSLEHREFNSNINESIQAPKINPNDELNKGRNTADIEQNENYESTITIETENENTSSKINSEQNGFKSEQFDENSKIYENSANFLNPITMENLNGHFEKSVGYKTIVSTQSNLKKSKATNDLVKLAEEFENDKSESNQMDRDTIEASRISDEEDNISVSVNDKAVEDDVFNEKLASFEIPDYSDLDLEDPLKLSIGNESRNSTVIKQQDIDGGVNNHEKNTAVLTHSNNHSYANDENKNDELNESFPEAPHILLKIDVNLKDKNELLHDNEITASQSENIYSKIVQTKKNEKLNYSLKAKVGKDKNIEKFKDNMENKINKFNSKTQLVINKSEYLLKKANVEKANVDKPKIKGCINDELELHPLTNESQLSTLDNILDEVNDEPVTQIRNESIKNIISDTTSDENIKSDNSVISKQTMKVTDVDNKSPSNHNCFGTQTQTFTEAEAFNEHRNNSPKKILEENSDAVKSRDDITLSSDEKLKNEKFTGNSSPRERQDSENESVEIVNINKEHKRLTLTDFMKKTLNFDNGLSTVDIINKSEPEAKNEDYSSETDNCQKVSDKKMSTKSRYEAAVKIQSLYRGFRCRNKMNCLINNSSDSVTIPAESQIKKYTTYKEQQHPNNSTSSEQVTQTTTEQVAEITSSTLENDQSLSENSTAQIATPEMSSSVEVGIQSNVVSERAISDSNRNGSQENVPGQVFVIIVSKFHPTISYRHGIMM